MKNNYAAIMQPYLFPYIGYFHLIQASDVFVFYDDVNYIKQGWINRNKTLNNGEALLFSAPIMNPSSNKLINETLLVQENKWKDKFQKHLTQSYGKAPYFTETLGVVSSVLDVHHETIAEMAIASVLAVYEFLSIPLNYATSSDCSPSSRGMNKADRLIRITKELGYKAYVNAQDGKVLYSKEYFSERGVDLAFVSSNPIRYRQFSNEFIPRLSIIDVLMFNDKECVSKLLSDYELE